MYPQAPNGAIIDNVSKIAVVRANGIGDFVFALPALQALRRAYPHAELVYLGLPWHAGFLPDRTPVDRVIVVPPIEGVGATHPPFASSDDLADFFSKMRAEKFDIALQMHGGGRYSNLFVRSLGARVTAGLRSYDATSLDRNIPYIYYHNEYARYLEVAGAAGATPRSLDPSLTLLPSDIDEASELVPGSPFAVLNAGAGDPRRRWPADRFASIGDWLSNNGYSVVLTGSEDDASESHRIAGFMQAPAHMLCGRTSLGGLLGVTSLASMVVSNDSGPLHLAVAAGTPSVGLYWCVNLVNSAPANRGRHRPVTSWTTHCPLCGTDVATDILPAERMDDCQHEASFVDAIEVWQVQQAVQRLDADVRQRTAVPVSSPA